MYNFGLSQCNRVKDKIIFIYGVSGREVVGKIKLTFLL